MKFPAAITTRNYLVKFHRAITWSNFYSQYLRIVLSGFYVVIMSRSRDTISYVRQTIPLTIYPRYPGWAAITGNRVRFYFGAPTVMIARQDALPRINRVEQDCRCRQSLTAAFQIGLKGELACYCVENSLPRGLKVMMS